MPRNDALDQALRSAGLTSGDLANALDVDAKTATRWVSRGRVPHPRHRVRAAQVLREDVDVLWPAPIRHAVKTGADREVLAVYPRRADMPRTLFADLISAANTRLWFGGYTSYFIWLDAPRMRAELASKVSAGADVRFLLGDPASEVTRAREAVEDTPLTLTTRIAITRAELVKLGVPVAVRLTDQHISMSVWVFDDDALVSTHIGAALGQDSVTMHLRRRQDDGPFARYMDHFGWLWSHGQPGNPL